MAPSEYKTSLLVVGGFLALLGLIIRGCNNFYNNNTLSSPSQVTHSYARGMSSHVELTAYTKGYEVRVQPEFSNLRTSQLDIDVDGDTKVDRIRKNDGWRMNKLSILVRDTDYATHQQEFDKADERLQGLIAKYGR